MYWKTTLFKPIKSEFIHLLLLMSDKLIYEAEYLPETESVHILSTGKVIPVNSEHIEYWTYACYNYTTDDEIPRPENYYEVDGDEQDE